MQEHFVLLWFFFKIVIYMYCFFNKILFLYFKNIIFFTFVAILNQSPSAPFFQQHLIFVSHFGNSHNITNFFIIIFVVVICGRWGLMLLLCLTEGSGDGYCFSAMKYFSIKVCIHFLDIMLLYT